MSWTTKNKIATQGGIEEIHTPDGQQILVGAAEDEVLIYQEEFIDWTIKTKIPA